MKANIPWTLFFCLPAVSCSFTFQLHFNYFSQSELSPYVLFPNYFYYVTNATLETIYVSKKKYSDGQSQLKQNINAKNLIKSNCNCNCN